MKKRNVKQNKKKVVIYKSLQDVKCPICEGIINRKWFNFRTGNVVEFIAECWSANNSEHHIFYFQIEVPECLLLPAEGSKVFDQ